MNLRILILSVVIPFFLGISSQAGLLDTQTLPGTQPQTPVGAQQVPRGTTINPLPDLVPAFGAVSGGNVVNGVCKSPVHVQLGAKNTKPYPVTTSFFIKLYHVGVLVKEWQVPGLEGNTEKLFDYSYATTCQPMPSQKNFKLVIDPDNAVREADKNNNVMDIGMAPP